MQIRNFFLRSMWEGRTSPSAWVFFLPLLSLVLSLLPTVLSAQSLPSKQGSLWEFKGFFDTGGRLALQPDGLLQKASAEIFQMGLGFQIKPVSWASFHALFQMSQHPTSLDPWFLLDQIVQQAYGELRWTFREPWLAYLHLGRFLAPLGWDSLNTPGRLQATISYPMLMTPNTLLGGRLGVRGSWLDGSLFVVNAFDLVSDKDTTPTIGTNLTFLWGPATWSLSATYGREPLYVAATFQADPVAAFDTFLALSFWGERFLVVGEGTLLFHPSLGRFWYTFQAALHGKPLPWLGLTTRFSRFVDPAQLFSTAASQDEWSLAAFLEIFKGTRFLVEYRLERTNDAISAHLFFFKMIMSFEGL